MTILARLTEFAARMEIDDPVVQPIRSFATVRISSAGKLLGITESPKDTFYTLPREVMRSGLAVRANCLWDKATYMFGVVPEGGTGSQVSERQEAFAVLHEELAARTNDKRLKAVARFCRSNHVIEKVEEGNYVLFFESDTTPIGSRPEIREILRADSLDKVRVLGRGTCPVTGLEDDIVVGNHAKIKPLAGSNASGGSLVSFDPQSSWSYGNDGVDHCPIGARAFFAYPTALRWLLTNRRLRLSDSLTLVWWTDRGDARESPLEGIVRSGLMGKQEELRELYDALGDYEAAGFMAEQANIVGEESTLYVAALAGANGRAQVADWFEVPSRQVLRSMHAYLARFVLDTKNGTYHPNLRDVLESSDHRTQLQNVRPAASLGTVRAVLTGSPYPMALRRECLFSFRRQCEDVRSLHQRIRMRVLDGAFFEPGIIMTDKGFDFRRTDVPYLLGALFAVMEDVQRRAIPSIRRDSGSKNVVARWFREASQRPAKTFPHLQYLTRNHLQKMFRRRAPMYQFLDRLYMSILDKMIDPMPLRLDWQGSTLFILGFEHMRNALFEFRRARPAQSEEDRAREREAAEDASAP